MSQVRKAHTFDVPDFGDYKDPVSPNREGDITRRAFAYLVMGAAGATYVAAAKVAVRDLVDTMNASADVMAMANIEVDLSTIPEGTGVTVSRRRVGRMSNAYAQRAGQVARQAAVYSAPHGRGD
jgi:ubiquinol-cytochrome c reductase iron-sulfur subunit